MPPPPKSTWTERARAISFDPSGLVVVKGIHVQKALEELDNYVSQLSTSSGQNGESAYQIWLDAGNTGTEEDFLASLKGDPGDPGADGEVEISSAVINANYNLTNVQADVPGAQLVVPANSGPFEVEVVGGIYTSLITGTLPANTILSAQIQIVDETGAVVAYSSDAAQATGTNVTVPRTIPLGQSFPNFAIDKTYKIQARINPLSNGASGLLLFAGIFPARTFRAIRR